MASTVGERYANGKIRATNADLTLSTPGFTPKRVVVRNTTTLAMIEWNDVMTDAYAWKTVSAGTRTLETAKGITPTTGVNPGFTIGDMADMNDTTTEDMEWEAWG